MMARKLFVMGALLMLAAEALAACGGNGDETQVPAPTPASAFPLTIEQSNGQQLMLERAPQRIVSLGASATEIFCAIGAGDQLAAVEKYANCPAGSSEKPELDAFEPNLEAIAGFGPDLVYVSSDRDDIVQAFRNLGITVLFRELPSSLEGVLDRILLFGRITGHETEAQEVVQSMRERMNTVRERVADVEQGPRIFHELDPTYFTVSPDSFVGDFYNLLKAENIAAGAIDEYPQLSAEVIIARDPEVLILADEPAGVTAESARERPGWDTLSAVKNGRICEIDTDIVSRPGPRIVDGLEALAQCLYPERFP